MKQNNDYVYGWQKAHRIRVRVHKLAWYYKNRGIINLVFSKPKGTEDDEADFWLLAHQKGEGWAF